jgi:hypothetical protein
MRCSASTGCNVLLLKNLSAFAAKLNMPESFRMCIGLVLVSQWGHLVFDIATTARLRAVLDQVCESVSQREIGARHHVASIPEGV